MEETVVVCIHTVRWLHCIGVEEVAAKVEVVAVMVEESQQYQR